MESYLESEGLTAKTDKLRKMMTEHTDCIAKYDRYWRPCIIVKVDN